MVYREGGLVCPACNAPLTRVQGQWNLDIDCCVDCKGIWVSEETLAELYRQMWKGYEPRWLPRLTDEPTRACPRCARLMKPSLIEIVEFERCLAHGIWFDAGELEQALELRPLSELRPKGDDVVKDLADLIAGVFQRT
jgi:Zn-finger nucleic acid-binding protein